MTILRQGDVALVRINDLPPDAVRVDTNGDPVVIAHGEVTGHRHQFRFDDAEIYRSSGGAMIVKILRTTALMHEEHDPIAFDPGVYIRPVQVEWTDAMEPRVVAD